MVFGGYFDTCFLERKEGWIKVAFISAYTVLERLMNLYVTSCGLVNE
jgi:hypothetical protein